MCGDCWLAKHYKYGPDGYEFKPPIMLGNTEEGSCCFCKNKTVLGIFVRHDPKTLSCDCEA